MDQNGIIGHERQLKDLQTDLTSGNVAHAYLFTGPPHIGKTLVARWFGTELLTEGLDEDARAQTLRDIERMLHPDFLSLDQLWIEDQMEDLDVIAQSSNISQAHRRKAPAMRSDIISIDDIRVIQDKLQETGTGGRRVCFIRSVDRLQDAAANAFLKILEEPPVGRVFILTAGSETQLLPTIVSRARTVAFDRVADRLILPLLSDVPKEDRPFLLHLSQGAPGRAIALASDPDLLREERLMHSQALSFWGPMSLSERLKLLSPLAERGEEAERFLLHLALALRESPTADVSRAMALRKLIDRFQTNAYRPVMLQEFALSLA